MARTAPRSRGPRTSRGVALRAGAELQAAHLMNIGDHDLLDELQLSDHARGPDWGSL